MLLASLIEAGYNMTFRTAAQYHGADQMTLQLHALSTRLVSRGGVNVQDIGHLSTS